MPTTFASQNKRVYVFRIAAIVISVAIVLTLGPAPVSAQKKTPTIGCTLQRCDSGFRPEVNGWATRNTAYGFTRSTGFETMSGACYGMVRLAQVAFDPARKDTSGLYQDTRKMDALARQLFAVTSHALTWNTAKAALTEPGPPLHSTFEGIRAQMIATGKPQVLMLSSSNPENAVGHTLLVTGFEREGDRIVFTLYDPNRPYRPDSEKTRTWLEYTKETGGFNIFSSDAKGIIYSRYDQVRHDRDEQQAAVIKTTKALMNDARDGKIDTQMGIVDLAFSAGMQLRNSIKLVKDKKLGGVIVYYDPALLDGEFDDEAVGALLEDLLADLKAGRTNLALRLNGGKEESFVTISLKSWLASGSSTLGDLTRVRGFVLKGDDIILVGQIEANRPKIDSDMLVVALKTIYRDGRSPGVSLDMDPKEPFGAQKARVVDVPVDLVKTEFVRVMFDADYLMKRILFNEERVSAPGYESHYDLVQRSPRSGLGVRRFWLTPEQSGSGEVMENGTAFLFESEVRVMTQKEKRSDEDFPVIEPNDGDQLDDRSSKNLTRYYPDIETEKDAFYLLHQLFDLSKLAAILRHKRIQTPVLDEMMAKTPRVVNRRDEQGNEIDMLSPYRGIGPKLVEGTNVIIGGGIDLKLRFDANSFARSERLDGLTTGKSVLALERSLPLPDTAYLALLIRDAANDCLESRFRECVDKSSRALDDNLSPFTSTRIRMMRALALFELGETKRSLADMDLVVAAHAEASVPLGLRAGFRLYSGDIAGAKSDAARAVKAEPHETIWKIKAEIDLCDLDFRSARDDIEQLATFDPIGPAVFELRTMSRFLQRLPKETARQYIRNELSRPIPIARAHLRGRAALAAGNTKRAVAEFQRILKLASERSPSTGVDRYPREEALFWLAIAKAHSKQAEPDTPPVMAPQMWDDATPSPKSQLLKTKRPDTGIDEARKLITLRPSWGSGYLVEAFCRLLTRKGSLNKVQMNSLLRKAFSGNLADDPLANNLLAVFGDAPSVRRYFYVMAYMSALESRTDGNTFLAQIANESSFEGRLARNLMVTDLVKDRQSFDAALPKIRPFAREALVTRPRSDFGANVLWFTFINSYMNFEEVAGNRDAYRDAAKVLFSYSPDASPPDVINMLAFMRAKLIEKRASYFEHKFESDPELKLLAEQAAAGQPRLDEIGRRVSQLSLSTLEEPWANVTSFNKSVNSILFKRLRLRIQLSALDQNRGYPGRTQEEFERLENVKTTLKAQYQEQMIEVGDDLDTLLDDTHTITDLKTIEKLGELLVILDGRLDRATKRRLTATLSSISAKIMVMDMVRAYE